MNWNDEDFEAFLRQFQPLKPRALPNRGRTLKVLATAALLLLALAVSARVWRATPPGSETTTPAASIRPPNAGSGQPVQTETLDGPAPSSRGRGAVGPGTSPAPQRAGRGGTAPMRVRVGDAFQPPVRIVNVNPEYPPEAQAAGIEGTVVLECVIGVDGSVIETRVLESIPELDQAAIDAVEQWHYQPTLLNGEPIEIEITVTISFTLR